MYKHERAFQIGPPKLLINIKLIKKLSQYMLDIYHLIIYKTNLIYLQFSIYFLLNFIVAVDRSMKPEIVDAWSI